MQARPGQAGYQADQQVVFSPSADWLRQLIKLADSMKLKTAAQQQHGHSFKTSKNVNMQAGRQAARQQGCSVEKQNRK